MKRIKSIKLHNSAFFEDGFSIEFSDKLNCLMGGRGTGKSTILCFIDACSKAAAEQEKNSFEILKSNLGEGTIVLEIESEAGGIYEIHKALGDEAQPYIKSNGQFISIEAIASEIELDIYPAQKIEEIGKSYMERLRLIDRMLKGEVGEIEQRIELQRLELKKNANDIRKVNLEIDEKKDRLKEFGSVNDDLKALKAEQPPDIKKEDEDAFNSEIEKSNLRKSEKRYLTKICEFLQQTIDTLQAHTREIETGEMLSRPTKSFINKDILQPLSDEIGLEVKAILSQHKSAIENLQKVQVKVSTAEIRLAEAHASQDNKFVELKQKQEKHKKYYDQLNALEKRKESRSVLLKEVNDLKKRRELLAEQRSAGVGKLNTLKTDVHSKRLSIVQKLNNEFKGSRIKVTLTQGGIRDKYKDAVGNGLKGHGLRYNILVPSIISNFTPDQFAQIIYERNVSRLKEITGIDKERSQAIIDALYETDEIYDIETIYCPDLPDFYLKVDRQGDLDDGSSEHYRKSDQLSTGQRCTTVLPVVFAISDNPLIIDQPEDNLDNRFISDTIRNIIKEHKGHRQLIFITHNPNIPVLSEAELNIFLTFEDKTASVLARGTVDEVKANILGLLEGGEAAFVEREKLYNINS